MGYSGNVGSWNNACCGGNTGYGYGSTFVLIVVLFILLIIVGASFLY
ncbi:YjcZ family sporulation protein [Lysinibacillus pakistanensis]|uniref:YjcZ family sporulation protein n=1 Tax=Lysinibacillus pakistanensis TaxID=759811 RepID=A0AAX3X1G3_9BACI|nr:YjcZ family sporulation protein [Lysinibacillus pakistanensis]MDM5233575.1 YjcZ family sporulation protein [Lysinibacillus pakistanensis]WHY49041.1 YjcZ family sporulation protein [Lysinibacillus pakistanensis]WHY54053.1 YjcZ family sporulation protein [Lysinibacillus pakistanensis]